MRFDGYPARRATVNLPVVPRGPAPGAYRMRKLGHVLISAENTGHGTIGLVQIDGKQIEGGISSLMLTMGVDRVPTLELSGAMAEFGRVDAELRGARYGMSKKTREALIELGWTPPRDGE